MRRHGACERAQAAGGRRRGPHLAPLLADPLVRQRLGHLVALLREARALAHHHQAARLVAACAPRARPRASGASARFCACDALQVPIPKPGPRSARARALARQVRRPAGLPAGGGLERGARRTGDGGDVVPGVPLLHDPVLGQELALRHAVHLRRARGRAVSAPRALAGCTAAWQCSGTRRAAAHPPLPSAPPGAATHGATRARSSPASRKPPRRTPAAPAAAARAPGRLGGRACAVNCVPASMMTAHSSPAAPTLLTCRPSARPLVTCTSRRQVATL